MLANEPLPKLGEVLVSHGLVNQASVDEALTRPGRLASVLLQMGMASERALATGLAEQQGHPAVILSESTLDLLALSYIPQNIAEAQRVLPLWVDDETIAIAASSLRMPDGRRPAIFDQMEFATGKRPVVYLAVDVVIAQGTAVAYEAFARGERWLSGHTMRPEPDGHPLSIVRPGSTLFHQAPASFAPAATDELVEVELPPDEDIEALPLVTAAADPTVLVVDDEDDIRALLRKVLTFDGYNVIEARTGREALEKLRSVRPDLIFLDAMLPEIHGFDICATLKQSDTFKSTPIIMVTAIYRGWEHAKTVQETHGADCFIEKPFDIHYIRQLAARFLGKDIKKTTLAADWAVQVRTLREQAAIAFNAREYDASEEAIKKWRSLDPIDANAYLMLGNVKTKQRDFENAMKAYERACTFDGDLFAAFKNLAVIYDQLGFVRRAESAWSRAKTLAPDDAARARIDARLSRPTKAA